MKTDKKQLKIYNKRCDKYQKLVKKNSLIYSGVKALNPQRRLTFDFVVCYTLYPALFAFVKDVIKRALKDEINCLYFLARDAYLLYHAAKIIVNEYNLKLEIKYLCISRLSINSALLQFDRAKAIDFMLKKSVGHTAKAAIMRLGFSETQAQNTLYKIKFKYDFECVLDRKKSACLKSLLLKDNEFFAAVKSRSQKNFKPAIGYLKQMGLLDDKRYAVVDSGWTGSLKFALCKLLKKAGRDKPVYGYYWGLYSFSNKADIPFTHCFYFYPYNGLLKKVRFNNNLFEALCMAPHGMTSGYTKDGNIFKALFAPFSKEVKDLAPDFKKFVKGALENTTKAGFLKADFKVIPKLVRLFFTRPTYVEAKAFSTIPFSDDVMDNFKSIAPPLEIKKKFSHYWWYEGSAALSLKRKWPLYTAFKYLRHLKGTVLAYILWKKDKI